MVEQSANPALAFDLGGAELPKAGSSSFGSTTRDHRVNLRTGRLSVSGKDLWLPAKFTGLEVFLEFCNNQ